MYTSFETEIRTSGFGPETFSPLSSESESPRALIFDNWISDVDARAVDLMSAETTRVCSVARLVNWKPPFEVVKAVPLREFLSRWRLFKLASRTLA